MTSTVRKRILLSVAALAGAAAAALILGLTLRTPATPVAATTTPSPAATATPTPAQTLSKQALCRQLGPHLEDAQTVITDFVDHPDGSTITITQVAQAADNLHRDQQAAPEPELKALIRAVRQPLTELEDVLSGGPNRTIDLETYRIAAMDLFARCGR